MITLIEKEVGINIESASSIGRDRDGYGLLKIFYFNIAKWDKPVMCFFDCKNRLFVGDSAGLKARFLFRKLINTIYET